MNLSDIIQSLRVTARKMSCSGKGLDQSLLAVHEGIKHYPAWISRGAEYVAPEFKNPKYISQDLGKSQIMSFEFGDSTYVLKWVRKDSYFESEDDKRYGSISLIVKDDPVLAIKTMRYNDPDYCPETLDSIEGYIPGAWESDLLKMREIVDRFENSRRQLTEETHRSKKKSTEQKDFGL